MRNWLDLAGDPESKCGFMIIIQDLCNFFSNNPTYKATIHLRYRWTDRRTDGRTDNLRWQYRAWQFVLRESRVSR